MKEGIVQNNVRGKLTWKERKLSRFKMRKVLVVTVAVSLLLMTAKDCSGQQENLRCVVMYV